MAATNLRDERVDQMVVLEGPGELSPFVAALAGPTVDFVAEKIGEACIAAGPGPPAAPPQQGTAGARGGGPSPPQPPDEHQTGRRPPRDAGSGPRARGG